jgi:hypothetical protein
MLITEELTLKGHVWISLTKIINLIKMWQR